MLDNGHGVVNMEQILDPHGFFSFLSQGKPLTMAEKPVLSSIPRASAMDYLGTPW
ncbi:hypothetical protein [Synechocystis salina]|uniref:hypothetical protein n=1 Tax=Synechocystis salina TaxID=945780 RepID=UPI0018801CD5|nr:hypothetical protein [Synechocystis salina]